MIFKTHKNTSCWASIQKYQYKYSPAKNKIGQTLLSIRPISSLRTCDHGPTLHWVGQGCRLQGLRVSGRSSLQCLLWIERVVLSSDGWTQLTERICIPVFPHGLLQFCHSPVTQLEITTGKRETGVLKAFKNVTVAEVNNGRGGREENLDSLSYNFKVGDT